MDLEGEYGSNDDDNENDLGQNNLPVAEPEEIEEPEDHCRDVSKVEEHGVNRGHQRPVSGLRVPGAQLYLSPNTQHLTDCTHQLTILY